MSLGRSDVVARRPVIVVAKTVEVFGDDLLTARESVAAIDISVHEQVLESYKNEGCTGQEISPESLHEAINAWNELWTSGKFDCGPQDYSSMAKEILEKFGVPDQATPQIARDRGSSLRSARQNVEA